MAARKKAKRKTHKTSDPTWDTHTYGHNTEDEKKFFNVEWMKYYNQMEGRDQIIFIYTSKSTKKIIKYRILR